MPCAYMHALTLSRMTANMYSEMRGEARDHARLRNAYFEQVYLFTLDAGLSLSPSN